MPDLQGTGFYISKRVGKAMFDFKMLSEGDTIAVAVSGGKDSLTLLRVLHERRKFVPIPYKLAVIYVDSGHPTSYASVIKKYCRKIGVPCYVEKIDLMKENKQGNKINCFWCSWNRRKALFETVARLGYKTLALGHHKDDAAETLLLNLFFHGEISAMCPRQEMFGGKIVIIRPLIYVEEKLIKKFAREQKLPVDDCVCPYATVSNRARMGRMIRDLEKICPEVKTNIFKSVQRIKKDYIF